MIHTHNISYHWLTSLSLWFEENFDNNLLVEYRRQTCFPVEKRKQEYGPGAVGIPSAVFSSENGSLASSSVGDYNWEVILHYIMVI